MGHLYKNFSATFTAYPADIQPLTLPVPNQTNGGMGSMFECYLDGSVPIAEGDQIDANAKALQR